MDTKLKPHQYSERIAALLKQRDGEIRSRYKSGGVTMQLLANEYRLTRTRIGQIVGTVVIRRQYNP